MYIAFYPGLPIHVYTILVNLQGRGKAFRLTSLYEIWQFWLTLWTFCTRFNNVQSAWYYVIAEIHHYFIFFPHFWRFHFSSWLTPSHYNQSIITSRKIAIRLLKTGLTFWCSRVRPWGKPSPHSFLSPPLSIAGRLCDLGEAHEQRAKLEKQQLHRVQGSPRNNTNIHYDKEHMNTRPQKGYLRSPTISQKSV